MAKKKKSTKKAKNSSSKKSGKKNKNQIIMPSKKRSSPSEEHVLKPTGFKIMLAFFISLFTVFLWYNLIRQPYLNFLWVLIYLVITFLWIILSIVASSLFVYFSDKNRMAKITSYLILAVVFISAFALIYGLIN